jgi:hypothetical protein
MNPGALHTLHGRTQSLRDWAREAGLTKGCVASRLREAKSLEEALSKPARKWSHGPRRAARERFARYGVSEVFRAWVSAAMPAE